MNYSMCLEILQRVSLYSTLGDGNQNDDALASTGWFVLKNNYVSSWNKLTFALKL